MDCTICAEERSQREAISARRRRSGREGRFPKRGGNESSTSRSGASRSSSAKRRLEGGFRLPPTPARRRTSTSRSMCTRIRFRRARQRFRKLRVALRLRAVRGSTDAVRAFRPMTGATPPFGCLVRHGDGRDVHGHPTLPWGRSRSSNPVREGHRARVRRSVAPVRRSNRLRAGRGGLGTKRTGPSGRASGCPRRLRRGEDEARTMAPSERQARPRRSATRRRRRTRRPRVAPGERTSVPARTARTAPMRLTEPAKSEQRQVSTMPYGDAGPAIRPLMPAQRPGQASPLPPTRPASSMIRPAYSCASTWAGTGTSPKSNSFLIAICPSPVVRVRNRNVGVNVGKDEWAARPRWTTKAGPANRVAAGTPAAPTDGWTAKRLLRRFAAALNSLPARIVGAGATPGRRAASCENTLAAMPHQALRGGGRSSHGRCGPSGKGRPGREAARHRGATGWMESPV